MRYSPLTELALLARAPDEALDLERIVVSISRIGHPGLDPGSLSHELDRIAERVADAVTPSGPPDRVAAGFARVLGGDLGFRGSPAAHRSPDGSYLHRVLETRTGLPILLAILWMCVGRRIGVEIRGIGYPGHFLARLELRGAPIYVDPYDGGTPMEADVLLDRLPPGVGRAVLEPSPTRAIVTRVLTNLKNLHVTQRDHGAALGIVDRLLLVAGEVPSEVRDRGLLLFHLDRASEAKRDLLRYLTLAPNAEDRPHVETMLARCG